MFSVGKTLQRARLEQELDVATVAARTKINAKYLEAIEVDDRGSLPSSFFYKSFVHQYARTLSLDTKQIDVEIDRVLSADAPLPLPGQENPTSREVPPVLLSSHSRWTRIYASLAGFIFVLAACSGIYGWYQERSDKASRIEPVRAPVEQAAEIPASLPTEPAAQDTQPPIATPPPQPATADTKVLLDLVALEDTWVSVTSDGKPVFSGILAANQSKTVEGKEHAKMRVGNAAGIEVRLNGKPLGPLGSRGQVLEVVFTPDNFQVVSPAKESD